MHWITAKETYDPLFGQANENSIVRMTGGGTVLHCDDDSWNSKKVKKKKENSTNIKEVTMLSLDPGNKNKTKQNKTKNPGIFLFFLHVYNSN